MGEWLVLSPALPDRFDGIGDYSWRLTRALSAFGDTRLVVRSAEAPRSDLETVPSWQSLAAESWRARVREARGVLLQYMPQAFLRGDLRACVRWLDEARGRNVPVVLTVHEYWPPADGRLRRAAVRFAHRRMLSTLLARATHVVLSQPLAKHELEAEGFLRGRTVDVIPVGSNIDRTGPRSPDPTIELVLFGQPASMHEPTMAALGAWLGKRTTPMAVTWLNRSEEEMRAYWRERVRQPESLVRFEGGLSSDAVSQRLLAARIGLAPYVNGSSTRRTTLIAMLQHGLPLVGLDGLATSDVLRETPALRMSNEGEPAAFLATLESLVADRGAHASMSRAAERVYDEYLSWPRIARSYLPALRAETGAVVL